MERKVLLVDDDQVFNWVLTKMIGKVGYDLTIHSFLNGKTALDFIHRNYSDENFYTILLDINMPVLNGWGFLDELVKMDSIKNETLSIYIVSSSTDDTDKERAESYDLVNGYIKKPLSLEQIKSVLNH